MLFFIVKVCMIFTTAVGHVQVMHWFKQGVGYTICTLVKRPFIACIGGTIDLLLSLCECKYVFNIIDRPQCLLHCPDPLSSQHIPVLPSPSSLNINDLLVADGFCVESSSSIGRR